MLAGAHSLTAIAEWAVDAPQPVLAALGARRDPLTGTRPPHETTMRRTLGHLDGDALDAAVGACWPTGFGHPAPGVNARSRTTALACAARSAPTAAPVHLLAACDYTQARCWHYSPSTARPTRSPRFQLLLADLDLAEVVVTADAMHTQRQHAEFLVTHKQADDLFHRQSQPAGTAHHGCSRCHGVRAPSWTAPRDRATARFEVHTLKVATVAA